MDKNQKTYNLICYIIDNSSMPTAGNISKICYLCDFFAHKKFNHQISGIEYEKDYRGIIGKRIDDYLNELVNSKKVGYSIEYTTDGTEYVRYYIPTDLQNSEDETNGFSDKERSLLDNVLRSIGSLNAQMLNKVAQETTPVKDAEKSKEPKVALSFSAIPA